MRCMQTMSLFTWDKQVAVKLTTPGWANARDDAPVHLAFRDSRPRRHPNYLAFAAPWLAYALPYRRFADTLASANARFGADADR